MPLYLRTLGRTELESAEPLPGGMTSGRPLLLLVYLALHPDQDVDRSYLTDLLWGDGRDEPAGRRSLRQALYVVGQTLPDQAIEADRHRVRLTREVPNDASDLEAALADDDAARVAALYHGPFLAGMETDAPPAFQHWVERKRVLFARRAVDVLLRGAERSAEEAGADEAVELLRAASRIDHFELAAEVRKVELWLRLGRPSEAADVAWRTLEQSEELDLLIPPEDRAYLGAATSAPPPEAAAEPAGLSFPLPPQLAGRARERAELLAAWKRAASRQGITVLLLGPPGIGKSRLIAEVVAEAKHAGATVLEGRSYALESGLLYGSLVEVLRQALDAPGFAGIDAAWLPELARLLPEVRERYPDLDLAPSAGSAGRSTFYEAVAQVFEALSYEHPVLCVLDDLHWADEATLELLHYLGRRLCACPVLFVAGIRPGQASDALRRLERTLARERGGVVLELEPLEDASVAELVSSMLGHRTVPTALADHVVAFAQGNPFFAVSMVEALMERDCITLDDAGLAWDGECAEGLPGLPREVSDLIGSRLAALPDSERQVLEAGAVVGGSFASGLVAAILGRDPERVEADLARLAGRGLVRRSARDGRALWEFSHDRVREVVYDGLAPDRRAALHAAVAAARPEGRRHADPGATARHAALAGDHRSAFQNALEAADWACSVFAYDGAREMLRVALEHAPGEEARARVEAELATLPPPSRARTPPGASPSPRLSFTMIGVAAALALAVSATALLRSGGAAPGPAPGSPPLPEGIIVRVVQGDSEHVAILDSADSTATLHPVSPSVIRVVRPEGAGRTLLSPDGRWVAALQPAGSDAGPDVFAFRTDGTDTLRVTADPADDVPQAWFPDGKGLLISEGVAPGSPDFAYHLFRGSLDGARLRPLVPDSLRGVWWFNGNASVTPDGTRIAVWVRGDRPGIWLMDADAGNARRIWFPEAPVADLSFSPDGRSLAFFEAGGQRLSVLRPRADSAVTTKLPGRSDGNAIVWSPDGARVLFSVRVEGNVEVFSFAPGRAELRRLTVSNASEYVVGRIGARPPFVDRVEIVTARSHLRSVLLGDSIRVSAVARDSSGAVVPHVALRLACLSNDVCRVRDGWLEGRARGATSLVASAGGWRADTLGVRVLGTNPTLAFSETWERGIDSNAWQAFGAPAPITVPGQGRHESASFQPNGDGDWNSGVVTRRTFPTVQGLTLDFWGRGVFDGVPWPSWQWMGAGFSGGALDAFTGTGAVPVNSAEVVVENGLHQGPAQLYVSGRSVPFASFVHDPSAWHHYTFEVLPDGSSELWIDGRHERDAPAQSPLPSRVRLVLFGRDTNGPVLEDDVRIYEGILLAGGGERPPS